jgi:hypothetical protein
MAQASQGKVNRKMHDAEVLVDGVPYSKRDCMIRAVEANPLDGKLWAHLANCMADGSTVRINGVKQTKKQCCVKAVELDPEGWDGWGALLLTLGDDETVMIGSMELNRPKCAQMAFKLNPKCLAAWQLLEANDSHTGQAPAAKPTSPATAAATGSGKTGSGSTNASGGGGTGTSGTSGATAASNPNAAALTTHHAISAAIGKDSSAQQPSIELELFRALAAEMRLQEDREKRGSLPAETDALTKPPLHQRAYVGYFRGRVSGYQPVDPTQWNGVE